MNDLGTMLWKEFTEFFGNRRSLRVFGLAIILMAILPVFVASKSNNLPPSVLPIFMLIYANFAALITTAQMGTDSVLHERASHTLETLLATRLPDGVLFGGKVLATVILGYMSSLVTIALQEVGLNLFGKAHGIIGFNSTVFVLLFLAAPLLLTAYLATVAVFVGLRVSDQRSAYLLTMVSILVLALPVILHLVHPHLTLSWVRSAMLVVLILDIILVRLGIALFRRDRLVLYLQD